VHLAPVHPEELARVDLLSPLPPAGLVELAHRATVRAFRAGETVVAEGELGDELHIVRAGLLNVTRPTAYPELVLHTLGPGAYFGELAVLGDGRRLATVVALQDSETVSIARAALDVVLDAHPGAVRRMLGNVTRSLTLAREALAQQNAELEQRVRERTEEVRLAHFDAIQRLARAAEWRDDSTGQHTNRMSRLVYQLAICAGFDGGAAEMLMQASTMHDVGKIGIPDRILLKPGPLDPPEWEHMKTHTMIGAELLAGSRSPILQLAELIARTHHERWDGTGYPAGLKGEDIPLPARICTICDVFDALVSERPYKRPWTVEEAVQEIRAGAGTAFDPRLVDVFLEHVVPSVVR
jgi:putative two-component system response regulator